MTSTPLHLLTTLDVEFDREAADGPSVGLAVAAKHRNPNGVVHGSVIHMLLDTVMGLMCFRAAGRQPVATIEISVRYLRPVVDGRLEARATVVKVGRRLVVTSGEVSCDGDVVAIGQATFAIVGDGPRG